MWVQEPGGVKWKLPTRTTSIVPYIAMQTFLHRNACRIWLEIYLKLDPSLTGQFVWYQCREWRISPNKRITLCAKSFTKNKSLMELDMLEYCFVFIISLFRKAGSFSECIPCHKRDRLKFEWQHVHIIYRIRETRKSANILSTDICVKRKPLWSLKMLGPLAFRYK